MRITGGQFKGRTLKTPSGDNVRPTQDCVREALFSILIEAVPGSRFLDLYAGTGAVGLEALSRGASDVQWVEGDRSTARLTKQNVTTIAGASYEYNVLQSDTTRYIRTSGKNAAFDIVFADPPYINARESGLKELAEELVKNNTIAQNGILVTEMPHTAPVAALEGWELLRDRKYGKTRIVLRRRLGNTTTEESEEKDA